MSDDQLPLPLGVRGRVPIGLQVVAGIAVLVVLVAISAAIAVVLALGMRDDHERLHERSVPFAGAVGTAALHAKGIANDERGYLLSGDRLFVTQLEGRIVRAQTALAEAAATAQGPAQSAAVARARTGFERWVRALRAELSTFRSGDRAGSIDASLGPVRALRKSYEASLAEATALGERAVRAGGDSVRDASSRSVTVLLAVALGVSVVGFAVALWVMRTILRPVYTMLTLFGAVTRPGSAGAPPPR